MHGPLMHPSPSHSKLAPMGASPEEALTRRAHAAASPGTLPRSPRMAQGMTGGGLSGQGMGGPPWAMQAAASSPSLHPSVGGMGGGTMGGAMAGAGVMGLLVDLAGRQQGARMATPAYRGHAWPAPPPVGLMP